MTILFSVSSDVTDAKGNIVDSTFEKDAFFSLRAAQEEFHATRTAHVGAVEAIECDTYPDARVHWVTVYNSMEYLTGCCESRTLFIPRHVTAASSRRIAKLLGARIK
jgi:hypothetical protein